VRSEYRLDGSARYIVVADHTRLTRWHADEADYWGKPSK
jgi:hypothetical protein